VIERREGLGEPRHSLLDSLDGRGVVGGGQDTITELVQPCAEEPDIRGNVVHHVADVRLVDEPDAGMLDTCIRRFLEPALEVGDRRFARPSHEGIVLVAGLPRNPGPDSESRPVR
jgi:hypothetical protein